MKKIIRLTESDLVRIVKQVIKENEEEWISQSQDMEMDSDFSKMEMLKQNEDFLELVDRFKEDPEMAKNIQRALEMNINESYKYYDYGDNKKEITRNHFLKRKLTTYGLSTLLAGIVGYTMGTMAGDDILQAALFMAGLGGGVLGTLSSEVGREKVKDEEEPINEMEDEDFMRGADRNWEDRDKDDDYKDRSMYSPYYGDDEDFEEDEEWGQTDMGEEELQDLIEEARDFLENECGYDLHDLNLMSEKDIVDALYDEGNDELAEEIEELLNQEGFNLKSEVEEELDEGWDDFTQKRRNPKGYNPSKYERIPKDYFKSPRRLDPEGTIGKPKKKEDFDDYEEVELDETWDDFTQKKRYPEGYKDEKYERIPKGFLKKHSGGMIDPEGTILTYADFTDDDPDNIDRMRGHLGLDDEDDDEFV